MVYIKCTLSYNNICAHCITCFFVLRKGVEDNKKIFTALFMTVTFESKSGINETEQVTALKPQCTLCNVTQNTISKKLNYMQLLRRANELCEIKYSHDSNFNDSMYTLIVMLLLTLEIT